MSLFLIVLQVLILILVGILLFQLSSFIKVLPKDEALEEKKKNTLPTG